MNNLPVTKTDLDKAVAKLVTKDELKVALAKLEHKIDTLDHKIDTVETSLRITFKFEIDNAVMDLDDKNKKYHDEIMTKFDDFLGEINDAREDRTITSHQLSNHENRITVLEQTAGIAVA